MKTVALIPAYNAAKTIEGVIQRIPKKCIDEIIIVDDGSQDETHALLKKIDGLVILRHLRNRGYGAAQITLYKAALERKADYIVIIHADGGLYPEEIPNLIEPLLKQEADIVVGSRIKGIIKNTNTILGSKFVGAALNGPMPTYKFISNIVLTAIQNLCFGTNYSSFHCGFRACKADVLYKIPFDSLTSWYQYDTEFLLSAHTNGLKIMEVPVSAYYSKEAGSSVPGIRYGCRVLTNAFRYALFRRKLESSSIRSK